MRKPLPTGADRTPRQIAYARWRGIITRCTNPNSIGWAYYGGRGISVCDEWRRSFAAFYAYVGDCPAPDMTLDRIDNDGNYEPGNVRWATQKEQRANMRDFQRAKTHCVNGHLLDEANTYTDPHGWRSCRACRRDAAVRHYYRRRGGREAGAA